MGYELWKSNGTEAGTVLVRDIYPEYNDFYTYTSLTDVNGTLFFSAYGQHIRGGELWKSDGPAVGTVLLKDFYQGGSDTGPSSLTDVNGTLFFSARDGIHGIELWAWTIVEPKSSIYLPLIVKN